MANTYTELNYHCIWSTKGRAPLIQPEIEDNIWRLLAATASKHDMHIKRAGGIENHVHVLVEVPKSMSVSEAMKRLKGGSSNAINEAELMVEKFSWQDGYGAFTVSSSKLKDVTQYIRNQREHHQTQSFEDEYLAFLNKHEVEYDLRYVFD